MDYQSLNDYFSIKRTDLLLKVVKALNIEVQNELYSNPVSD